MSATKTIVCRPPYRVEVELTGDVEHWVSFPDAVRQAAKLARRTNGDVRVYSADGDLIWVMKSFLHRITDDDILHLITSEEINEAVRHLPDPAACDEPREICTSSSIGRVRIVFQRFRDPDGAYVWLPTYAEGAGRELGS